jgi:predicted transcriptional regulator
MDGHVTEQPEAIISIRPSFAEAILSGSKTIELRRKIPSIDPGTRIWIYATRPVGAVVGSALIERIIRGTPGAIWSSYGEETGVTHSHFKTYFDGAVEAIALFLTEVRRSKPVNIDKLRALRHGFHPPQVMAKITGKEAMSLRRWSDAP